MSWPEERLERAVILAGEAKSAEIISRILSREFGEPITRNAVIGFLHRRGVPLGNPQGKSGVRAKRTRKPKPKAINPVMYGFLQPKLEVIPIEPQSPQPADFLCVSILNLREDQCKFPRGEGAEITFCGQDRRRDSFGLFDSPYCHFCHRLCYAKPPSLSLEERQARSRRARNINAKRHGSRS